MKALTSPRATVLAALLSVLTLHACPVQAAPEPKGLGNPGKLQSVVIETGRTADGTFVLNGPDAAQQLLVTGTYTSGQTRDLTRQARYTSEPAGIVAIDAAGNVTPLKDGRAEITAKVTDADAARIHVAVTRFADEPRVGFANEIVPTFTKAGLQRGQLSRQGIRTEWLQTVAVRFRARRRL